MNKLKNKFVVVAVIVVLVSTCVCATEIIVDVFAVYMGTVVTESAKAESYDILGEIGKGIELRLSKLRHFLLLSLFSVSYHLPW